MLPLQVDRLSQQLQKLERELETTRSAEASARAEAASEAKRRALQSAEAEAAGANARSEHVHALNSLQAAVKRLEVRSAYLRRSRLLPRVLLLQVVLVFTLEQPPEPMLAMSTHRRSTRSSHLS